MLRDDDKAPDPRHERSGSGGLVAVLLALALLFVVAVAGGGFVLAWKVRQTRNAVGEEAEVARMEADQARTAAKEERSPDRAGVGEPEARSKQNPPGPGARLSDGRQLDPIPVTLATVSVKQTEQLAGRHLLVTFDLLDNDDRRGGYVVYSNDGPDSDGEGVERAVWVPGERRKAMKGRAVGRLAVVRHAAAIAADGTAFPAWVEVRAVLDR